MRIQISSGQGPAECELAVGLLYEELKREAPDIRLLSFTQGKKREGFSSIMVETEHDFTSLEGSVLWICKSPYRPEHKRKNWYVDVSILETVPRVTEEKLVRFETFKSGGKGGQNVNKVETGVQHMNKPIALNRLCEILAEMNLESGRREKNLAWMEHTRLERGNPVRVYEGRAFHLKRGNGGDKSSGA